MKYIEPYKISVFTCIEPLSASILSIIFLNVSFSLIQLVCALCIIITISILSFSKKYDESVHSEEYDTILN